MEEIRAILPTMRRLLTRATGLMFFLASHPVVAGTFAGPDPNIPGTATSTSEQSIRDVVTEVIIAVLNFLALLATIMIIIAGIRFIVSQGDDDATAKGKKTILYTIMGLLFILFCRVLVGSFASKDLLAPGT